MDERADAFLALPGGIGTLEELFEVWTSSTLGHARQAGRRAGPGGLLRAAVELPRGPARAGFVREAAWKLLHRVPDVDAAFDLLAPLLA